MATATVSDVRYSTTLVALECGECHIPFALPNNLYKAARDDGRFFYCPNGHHIHFYETELAKLRKENDQLTDAKNRLITQRNRAQAEAEHQRRVAIGTKGALVKTQKRVAKGVCPCCPRSFVNLARHMASQHPDYQGEVPNAT